LVLVVGALAPPVAEACAACGCGDPTLTAVGVEKPYANRVRLSVEERVASLSEGDPATGQRMTTLRSALTAMWAPAPRLAVAALVPWVTNWVAPRAGGPASTITGLGDAELSARLVLFRERKFAPQHLLWALAGLKMPTGPRVRDGRGYPYSDDDQPGSGSWDPFAGVTYGWFGGLTSVFVSTSYRYTTPGPRGYRFGSTAGASAQVQLQPLWWLAVAAGLDGRYADPDSLPNGHPSPNTGGVLLSLAPGVMISPLRSGNLLFKLAVAVPAVQALYGIQSAGPQVTLAIAWDLR
jgi:hypothetical protein